MLIWLDSYHILILRKGFVFPSGKLVRGPYSEIVTSKICHEGRRLASFLIVVLHLEFRKVKNATASLYPEIATAPSGKSRQLIPTHLLCDSEFVEKGIRSKIL